jgi:hypothetical protein
MKFTIYFLGDEVQNTPQPDRYRDALLSFDQDAWYEQSSGGASFAAKEEGRGRCTLTISPERGQGLSLLATVPGVAGGRAQEFASTTNPSRMNEFLRTGQDIPVPVGSFVTPEQAWWAIEDYLANPGVLSPRLNWTNTSTLSYPLPQDV